MTSSLNLPVIFSLIGHPDTLFAGRSKYVRTVTYVAIDLDKNINLKNRTIRVLQQKSVNYDEPIYIDITMGQELNDCIVSSRFSGINCSMLAHHKQRVTSAISRKKPHGFAVTPDYLTQAYSKIRGEVDMYNHLPKIERPDIHSLRALGIFAYSKAGYPDE